MDLNNSYKRFQGYQNNNGIQQNLKQNYLEQNYKIDNKPLGEKKELNEKKELPKQDNSFLKNATRLGVNNQGQFVKK